MFAVHTPERVFLLSTPSEDEMQSWVGMLQTLHHHNRTHQPGRAVSLKTPPLRAAGEDGESAGLHQRWGVWLVGLSEVLEHVVYHHSA